jgi:hypothetical protein
LQFSALNLFLPMIESLHISEFKLFGDISFPRLGRLNLFVGENNTGKTCLLQAVNLYAGLYSGRAPLTDGLQAAVAQSDDKLRPWDPADLTEEGTSLTHPIFGLFRRVGNHLAQHFVIERIGDRLPLRVEVRLHRIVTTEEGFRQYIPAMPGDVTSEGTEMALSVYRGDKQVGLITSRLPLRGRGQDGQGLVADGPLSIAYLAASGFSNEKAASMWDALVQRPGQELVLAWLRMLDPRIEDLAYIAGRLRSRVALLKIQDQGRIPLRSMGDGLTKLFHIALAAASAPKGMLLIDEFENGLHWTVQHRLWNTLARAAEESNVQVFCTTHSRDCIESFSAAVRASGSGSAAIYRLEHKGDDIVAADLPLVNVDAAMREHEEVR